MKVNHDIAYAENEMIVQAYTSYSESFTLPKTATNEENAQFFNVLSNIKIEVRALIIKAFEDAYGVEFESEEEECAKIDAQA